MSKTAWPTVAEVQAFIVSSGLMDACSSDVQDFIDGAVSEFERRTGYDPFLAESVDSVAYYDGPHPSNVLFFEGGYASITSVVYDSSTLVVGTDYELWPANAALKSEPYTALDLAYAMTGVKTITVTGKRGYGSVIPADAWFAALNKAGKDAAAHLSTATGDYTEVQQGPVSYKVGTGAGSESKRDPFEVAVRRYRKP